jgi:HEPN domain-containing protein
MKAITRERVDKAEADFATALLARRSRKKYSRDIVCFDLQQCVEKYLKARLVEEKVNFPKTHNLVHLLDLVAPIEPLWVTLRPSLGTLTAFGTEARYPGRSASPAETRSLLALAKKSREMARTSLGMRAT